MKKIFSVILIILGLSLNSFSQINAMSGKWKEIWGYGERTDVNYNDVFTITIADGKKIQIRCEDRPHYSFNNINVKGDTLTFEKKNDDYVMPYRIVLDNSKNVFWGETKDIHGQAKKVKWEKMPN